MKKLYVLDTSSLLQQTNLFQSFKNSTIVIPIGVLSELDKLKTSAGKIGQSARVVIKFLDNLSTNKNLHKGCKINLDCWLKIVLDAEEWDTKFGNYDYVDNRILATAVLQKEKHPERDVVVMSEDLCLRLKAKAFGLMAESCPQNNMEILDLYQGYQEIKVTDPLLMGKLKNENQIACKLDEQFIKLSPHECVHFLDNDGDGLALARKVGDKLKLIKSTKIYGLDCLNKEQAMAMDLLMDQNLPLVSLVGLAGSGKSLLALAAGLELVINRKKYTQLLVYRPIEPMGNSLGYLPGSLVEKISPWMTAIMDGLEFLLNKDPSNPKKWLQTLGYLQDKGYINMEALTYIRGRSLNNAFMLIDEAQNLSPEELKTILTRVGKNTKIVLTGDIEQIDSPRLDALSNGLSKIVECFKNSELAGHITLKKGERSALSEMAAKIL